MSKYFAKVVWTRGEDNFLDNRYSRGHLWSFDGGVEVRASSSPHTVPVPMSVEANVDPEEAFVASLSSCHMLWFLSVAAKKRYVVDSYIDEAVGVMEKDENGKLAMTKVILRPQVHFSGENQPSDRARQKMHQLAHENCFIANSVKTEVLVESA